MITKKEKDILISKAISVRKNAYSPYSKYKVGAALLTKNKKIFLGSNFENSAFGAGICAERVALGAALSAGEREFLAICICGDNIKVSPCGICRQALVEFNDIEVICCDEEKNTVEYRLSDLIPVSFELDINI